MATYDKQKESRLRVAKKLLDEAARHPDGHMHGKNLSPEERKIGSRLLLSLARKRRGSKKKAYAGRESNADILHLKDWVNNKDGIRDRVAWAKKSKKLAQTHRSGGFGDRPEIKEDYLSTVGDRIKKVKRSKRGPVTPDASAGAMESGRGAGIGNILRDPSGMEPGPQPKSYLKRKDAKPKRVLGRSPGDPFRKDKQLKKVTSASPTGTVASVSPRGAVLKAPEVSSRTQTSKEKQLSPFGTAFSNARKEGKDVFTFKGKKYTTELASPPRKRKSPPPAPKRKPTQKVSKEDQSVNLEDWSGGGELTVRPPLKPLEGGVRYKKLPDWLGGGEIKIDSTFEEEKGDNVTHGKKGGQVKKGVKKTKAKARRRAALRGHRAELRGG